MQKNRINSNFKQDGFVWIKILGNGSLENKLIVRANAFSASAKEKIVAAGGKYEVV